MAMNTRSGSTQRDTIAQQLAREAALALLAKGAPAAEVLIDDPAAVAMAALVEEAANNPVEPGGTTTPPAAAGNINPLPPVGAEPHAGHAPAPPGNKADAPPDTPPPSC